MKGEDNDGDEVEEREMRGRERIRDGDGEGTKMEMPGFRVRGSGFGDRTHEEEREGITESRASHMVV